MTEQERNFIKSIRLPKAVIFDTDNTLYSYGNAHREATHAVEQKAVKMLGIKKETFRSAFDEARKETKNRLGNVASSHSRLLYMQRTIELLGLGTRILTTLDLEQTYWRIFLNNCKLFPGVLDFIQLLKSRGVITANITDLTAQIQFRKLVYFGLDEFFDYVVTSEEVGKDKPNNRPFELALEKIQCNPDQVVMIGDSLVNDIKGAKEIGMQAFHKIHSRGETSSSSQIVPDFVFKDFNELIKIYNKVKK